MEHNLLLHTFFEESFNCQYWDQIKVDINIESDEIYSWSKAASILDLNLMTNTIVHKEHPFRSELELKTEES